MERWSGKVALVTGASSGIGAATVIELVKHGMIVVGLARRIERVEELKSQVGDNAHNLHAFAGDVTKEEDIQNVFTFIREEFNKIHVLVNCAGIARIGGFLESEPKHLRETLDVNVMGLTLCTQEAFRLMKESGVDDGHIIHINSIQGHSVISLQGMNMYPASKHAVTAITEVIRQELRTLESNIRVTSISPGAVNTEIFEASFKAVGQEINDEFKEDLLGNIMLESKDIADSIVYVLSTPPHVQVHEIIIKPIREIY